MQTFKVVLALALLGGCHRASSIDVPDADRIECAIGVATDFTKDCAIERGTDATLLTIHHADGGFRRLVVASDGSVGAADGADMATSHALADGRTEVAIGADRYRLPARK